MRIIGNTVKLLVGLVVVGVLVLATVGVYRGGTAIQAIVWENASLKESLSNLTDSGRIGYAKVIRQVRDEHGKVVETTLKFVETDRDDKLRKILEKEYTIPGDIIHFDALVVRFGDKLVMDGKKRSLYLWRRVYGEEMAPAEGFAIEEPGKASRRYEDLLAQLPMKQREEFWHAIWELASDPEKLRKYDIEAIYGNVTYTKVRPGLVYIFHITATGQVYPQVVPEI